MPENKDISPFSHGLNRPEGQSTCEGYDLRKHGNTLTSQTVESTYAGVPRREYADGFAIMRELYRQEKLARA